MHDYLSTPFGDNSRDWRETEIVALDLETTGLNPKKDSILSFGLVELKHNSIHLKQRLA